MQVAVEDVDLAGRGDEVRGDLTRTLTTEEDLDRRVTRAAQHQLLEVEDDVGHVLLDTLDGAELVQHALDAHAGHRGAGDGRQQGAAQAVAQRVAKPWLQRLDAERGTVPLGEDFFGDGGTLDNQH